MRHIPSRLVSNRKLPLKLFRGNRSLVRANQIDRQKPFSQGHVGIVEDGSHGHSELIVTVHALVEVPLFAGFPFGLEGGDARPIATETANAFRPSDPLEVPDAPLLRGELLNHFSDG